MTLDFPIVPVKLILGRDKDKEPVAAPASSTLIFDSAMTDREWEWNRRLHEQVSKRHNPFLYRLAVTDETASRTRTSNVPG